jgi:hypothetical protein
VIVLGAAGVAIVVGLVALWLRDRRRHLRDAATMSIRDHDQDRRVYGRGADIPPVNQDSDRFGGGIP